MADGFAKFISLDMSVSDPAGGQSLRGFALKMVFISISLSIVVSLAVICIGNALRILPLPVLDAVFYSVAMGWIVGGLVAGILCTVLGRAIRDLRESQAEFERLSKTDTLSGLANRRAFNQVFEDITGDASLAIFDLDRFKSINDNFGHGAGDMVIKRVASAIEDVFGDFHCVARLGGEEFGVIVCGGDRKDRVALIELARVRVACLSVNFEGHLLQTTVSVGVAEIEANRSKHDTFAIADKALYSAKAAGRNRLCHGDAYHARSEIDSGLARPLQAAS
ncbi:GGDEF domain-containing protein [uncultured Agrobacterium sp.]|uniref:GGDEF domain-containing protein n=1 Tax=uncultured Agrobacterium sp. TaxID=157277 RepID=UPI0025DE6B69|nr:GGDEF domain-containing protein [uncultured Agrobacterium sp.]